MSIQRLQFFKKLNIIFHDKSQKEVTVSWITLNLYEILYDLDNKRITGRFKV